MHRPRPGTSKESLVPGNYTKAEPCLLCLGGSEEAPRRWHGSCLVPGQEEIPRNRVCVCTRMSVSLCKDAQRWQLFLPFAARLPDEQPLTGRRGGATVPWDLKSAAMSGELADCKPVDCQSRITLLVQGQNCSPSLPSPPLPVRGTSSTHSTERRPKVELQHQARHWWASGMQLADGCICRAAVVHGVGGEGARCK
jgi:hypothetical protein